MFHGYRAAAITYRGAAARATSLPAEVEPNFSVAWANYFPRSGKPAATREGPAAYIAGSLLRSAVGEIRDRARSRPPWIFRSVDRHDGRAAAGRGLQPDSAWIGSAAARGLSRCETGKLQLLPDCVGLQPELHSAASPGSAGKQSGRVTARSGVDRAV